MNPTPRVFVFSPGAIFGKRGWTPVIRVMRDGKPVGSKTGQPWPTRDAALSHAGKAAGVVLLAMRQQFPDDSFTVRVVAGAAEADFADGLPVVNPVADAMRAIAEAVETAHRAPRWNPVDTARAAVRFALTRLWYPIADTLHARAHEAQQFVKRRTAAA